MFGGFASCPEQVDFRTEVSQNYDNIFIVGSRSCLSKNVDGDRDRDEQNFNSTPVPCRCGGRERVVSVKRDLELFCAVRTVSEGFGWDEVEIFCSTFKVKETKERREKGKKSEER